MSKSALLSQRGPLPFATGACVYADSDGPSLLADRDPKIVIQIAPEAVDARLTAVVDTAAPWCIFKPDIGRILQKRCEAESGTVTLSTRLGPVDGVLYRIPLTLPADEGSPLTVQATVFLSPEWNGGNFIGYMGLLQRIRFAVDPRSNLFYFGDL